MVFKMLDLEKPIVYIVDCDHQLLASLSHLLRLNEVTVEAFGSAEDFLKTKLRTRAACLIVEVNLLNMDGIQLLVRLPTIVMSTSSDVSDAVRAMQAKAIDFIEKPFIHNTLIERVMEVINQA